RSDRKVDAGKLMGRRLALNRKRMERFLEAIRLGVSFPGACDCVGWCDRSVYRYLKRGRDALEAADINEEEDPLEHLDKLAKSEQLFAELAVKYEAAMSGSEEAHLEKLLEFGKGDWKSRAWVLERRWPERYTRTRKIGADLAEARGRDEPALATRRPGPVDGTRRARAGRTAPGLPGAQGCPDHPARRHQERRLGRGHG
ncbi:MAG: hypothetical protein ACYTAN_18905, partial [Planctomycetota bacterium]